MIIMIDHHIKLTEDIQNLFDKCKTLVEFLEELETAFNVEREGVEIISPERPMRKTTVESLRICLMEHPRTIRLEPNKNKNDRILERILAPTN